MNDTDNSKKTKVSKGSIRLYSAVRWYMLGFALLGGAIGFFAGSSQSPVIGTLLPLLFGLIGGAGGLYLARVDLDESMTRIRLAIIGKAISCFIICTLVFSVYGVSLRTGRSLWSFFSVEIFKPEKHFKLTSSIQSDPKKAIALAMLRARIRALGVSSEEERFILEQAARLAETEEYAPPDAVKSFLRLVTLARRAKEYMSEAFNEKPDSSDMKDLRRSFRRAKTLHDYLSAYESDYKKWAEKIENGEKIPIAFFRHRIQGFQDTIEKLLHGYDGAAPWLSQHENARQSIWELQWALIDEDRNLASPTRLNWGSTTEEMDRFLSIFYGRDTESKTSSMPWKLPQPSYAH